jgi:glutamate-ammonia-ligase adenylyltransferase
VAPIDEKLEALIHDLPDPEGAKLFHDRITDEHPRVARQFARDEGLLADSLAIAAWSPLLAATLAQHPDYLGWLARERTQSRVRTTEELEESLARFSLTHSQLDTQIMLARFRRRELLRIYLHDIRRTTTLVETTEELSNLADAILRYALGMAQQELENLYGAPQCSDERGRQTSASFSIAALGKLGSRELNYASDIDLLFLYSDDGETTGKGERGIITNREFFGKLAGRLSRLVGEQKGEGAAYRVDLRLRPHGRDGALACGLAEALRYYRTTARPWELQVLIRARASAGSHGLFARFADELRGQVYREDATVARALADVRLSKQKIDSYYRETTRGFNVKLGRGGIREIEFIAQALQLAYGGRDPWLHAPHTLISLGRVADRGLITERERSELSAAYTFLRSVEHRVQMEHGLQTHVVPDDARRRTTLALRMHLDGANALAEFNHALKLHTSNVSAAFQRVFGIEAQRGVHGSHKQSTTEETLSESLAVQIEQATSAEARLQTDVALSASVQLEQNSVTAVQLEPTGAEESAVASAARIFVRHASSLKQDVDAAYHLLRDGVATSLNPKRSSLLLGRIAASLDKSPVELALNKESLVTLARFCGASELFGEIIAANPTLIQAVTTPAETVRSRDTRALMRSAIDAERSFRDELSALRRAWSRLIVEIGSRDASGEISLLESNRLQTSLAAASINCALLVARRELARRFGGFVAGPRLSVLGLGRLGSGGTDYGSDLDLVLVYDPAVPSPLKGMTHDEAYARLAELTVAALSNLTRDGHLYRVDLRLRPDGNNGPLTTSGDAFVNYLAERADVWEWLAYVKVRAVAGDQEYGAEVEERARRAVYSAADRAGAERLRFETRRMRDRLERERGGRGATDIKFGRGGMLDVYFAARFLQLRDHVPDDPSDRSTPVTLDRLRDSSSIKAEDHRVLSDGYALLRTLDHHRRLLVGRSTRLPTAEDHPVLRDLAALCNYSTTAELLRDLRERMEAVRAAFERTTS